MSNEIKTIIVLGMHRSGTSCLAGSLQESGIHFGDVSLTNKYNKKGNRENLNIINLNDKLLEYNNGTWDSPPRKMKWTSEHELEGKSIIEYFHNEQSSSWGFKDPRTLLTFPFWNNLLPQTSLVGTIRSPYSVAQSLYERDNNFTIDKGLQLWLEYNQRLLKLLNEKPFPLISFDLSNTLYKEKLNILKESLSLDNSRNEDFFDRDLRSKSTPNSFKYNVKIQNCYTNLNKFLS